MNMVVNPYRFAAAGGAWLPTDLADLVAWYDANQQTESDGSQVTTLVDRSGNGFDFVQSGSDNCPILRYANVNGKKAMEAGFALGMRHLECSSSLLSGASAATMMMVKNNPDDPSTSGNTESVVQRFTTAASPISHHFTDSNIYESFASTTRRNVNPTPSWAGWHIYGAHSGSGDYAMWMDGSTIHTDATNTVNTGATTRRMFYSGSPSADRFSGFFAELVLCDAVLGTSDRQKLEGYYAHKYGLTGNLPGGHPYISSPP